MGSPGQNELPRGPFGQRLFDAWQLNDPPSPDPLDVDLGDGRGNRREAARKRDFPEIARQMHEIEEERQAKESSPLFKLRQLGDAGLRAVMGMLKGEKTD
jgi:hypothetical protein